MSNPLVCAVMLVNGREAMVRRAVGSFRAQMYSNKRLYVYDTGDVPCTDSLPDGFPDFNIIYHRGVNNGQTIGELRNRAIWWGVRPSAMSEPDADIICHFDSDDWSHPQRIEEQVALLESSGADVVGYSECLFWDSTKAMIRVDPNRPGPDGMGCLGVVESVGQAYLYRSPRPNVPIGASLCFWRDTWKRRAFPHLPIPGNRQSAGEDVEWLKGVRCEAVAAIAHDFVNPDDPNKRWCRICGTDAVDSEKPHCEPRLICSIHSGNSQMYELALTGGAFKRVPHFDALAREKMAL